MLPYVIYGLLGVAVLIALMGIANTLSLSIHERTRELGLLRAVGQSRAQVRATVRWESVIVAVFGTIGGSASARSSAGACCGACRRRRASARSPPRGRRSP